MTDNTLPPDPFEDEEVNEILNDDDTVEKADPGTVAFLDQEGAAFQQERMQFMMVYGFDHDCHCAEDYASGKTKPVTECFLGLTASAMARSAQATAEIRYLYALVENLVNQINGLGGLLENLGHSEELEEFYTSGGELDEPTEEELDEPLTLFEPEDDEDDEGDITLV